MIVIVGAGLGTWALISPGEEKRKEQLKVTEDKDAVNCSII